MERWIWQDAIFTRDSSCRNLVHVIRVQLMLTWKVWAVRVEAERVVVTLRQREGTVEMPYNSSDTEDLVVQKLLAWRGDLFTEVAWLDTIVSWYRHFMQELGTYQSCAGLKPQIAGNGRFIRWRLGELSGAVEFFSRDGAEIAGLVAKDVIETRTAAVTNSATT
jgi:hypothetical protein